MNSFFKTLQILIHYSENIHGPIILLQPKMLVGIFMYLCRYIVMSGLYQTFLCPVINNWQEDDEGCTNPLLVNP